MAAGGDRVGDLEADECFAGLDRGAIGNEEPSELQPAGEKIRQTPLSDAVEGIERMEKRAYNCRLSPHFMFRTLERTNHHDRIPSQFHFKAYHVDRLRDRDRCGTRHPSDCTPQKRLRPCCPASAVKTYKSADFYGADGTFLADKAREAYFDMFRRFQYPISDKLQKEMWILDFGLNDFAHVGMAGIFWLNRQDYNYFGHEIYLAARPDDPGALPPGHRQGRAERWNRGSRGAA